MTLTGALCVLCFGVQTLASASSYNDPDQWNAYASQASSPVALTAGQSILLEAAHCNQANTPGMAQVRVRVTSAALLAPWRTQAPRTRQQHAGNTVCFAGAGRRDRAQQHALVGLARRGADAHRVGRPHLPPLRLQVSASQPVLLAPRCFPASTLARQVDGTIEGGSLAGAPVQVLVARGL